MLLDSGLLRNENFDRTDGRTLKNRLNWKPSAPIHENLFQLFQHCPAPMGDLRGMHSEVRTQLVSVFSPRIA